MAEVFNIERCRNTERRVDRLEEEVGGVRQETKQDIQAVRNDMRPVQDFLAWFTGADIKKQITESYQFVMTLAKIGAALGVVGTVLGIVATAVALAK